MTSPQPPSALPKKWYGVWCFELNDKRGGWLRPVGTHDDSVLAWSSIRAAWSAAAHEYGYRNYTQARRDGWVEVRPIVKPPFRLQKRARDAASVVARTSKDSGIVAVYGHARQTLRTRVPAFT